MSSRSAKSDGEPSAALPETVEVGRIRRPHGVHGEVLVAVSTDVAGRFSPGAELLAARQGEAPRRLRVAASRDHGPGLLLRFEGCESRTEAERLRGVALEVERARVPPAPAGRFYEYELVGCRCLDRRAGDLGRVVGLIQDGGGVLLAVQEGGRTLLVPFVEEFLTAVEVGSRRIELDLPPGLVDTCASRS